MQIDKENNLWVLTNTLPRFIYGKLDTNEYNFRIWRTNVFDAIRGTKCDWKHDHQGFENKWNDHEVGHGYGHDYNGEHEWDRNHELNWDRNEHWRTGGYNGYRHN